MDDQIELSLTVLHRTLGHTSPILSSSELNVSQGILLSRKTDMKKTKTAIAMHDNDFAHKSK